MSDLVCFVEIAQSIALVCRIDYALVLGSTEILFANTSLAFTRLGMLSPDGACKAFDAAGNGCVLTSGHYYDFSA